MIIKNIIIKQNMLIRVAKTILLLLICILFISCKNDNPYNIKIDNTKYIDENIIKTRDGRDYIVDEKGKEQLILDNIFDATVGEVAYFGNYGGVKIPFVVVRRNNEIMEIMSIPKFNLKRHESNLDYNKLDDLESFNLLNTVFLKTCFSDKEIKNIIPFEYLAGNIQIEPDKELLKKFDIVYDQNYKDKYANPTILSKVLLHEEYVNRQYKNNYTVDYGELDENNFDKVMASIDNMWKVNITDNTKGITYSYDFKDFVYRTGINVYKYNSRVELRLKNIETEAYKKKANGFKYIGIGSDKEEKDHGYYYLQNGNVVTNEIIENDGTKYYLSDDGKAIELDKFTIQDIDGISICIFDDVIIKDKILSQDEITAGEKSGVDSKRYYVDINGIVHNLVTDIKDADTSDTVEFGHSIEQPQSTLLWRVVENLGGVYTLILEQKIKLDIIHINVEKREEDIYDNRISDFDDTNTWDESDRRKYLNEKFYNDVFSDSEKEIIVDNPIRTESYLFDKTFSGIGDQDVYDKVFIFNQNTKDYMKEYENNYISLKANKPSVYNDITKKWNFSLIDSDMKSIRPWIVVNVSGKDVPDDENSYTNYNYEHNENRDNYDIPSVNTVSLNRVHLGKYLQFGSEETKVMWNLICIDKDIAYFVVNQVLDFEEIVEEKDKEVSWSNSKLRKWLNETFIHKLFSDNEISKLEKINKKYQYLDSYGNIKTEECEDYLTLLNYDEIPIYLSSGVRLSNKSFEKIKNIDKSDTSLVTSFFDNKSHKYCSARYKSDDFGDNPDNKIEVKNNNTNYVGIFPMIAINIDNVVDLSSSPKVKKNIDKKEEYIKETKDNCHFLYKSGLYGDVVRMGKYQNEDIEWIVLNRKREYALVIAKNVLFNDNVLGRYGTSSWETSNVRKELNEDIYKDCFTTDEKNRIIPVKLTTEYTEAFVRKDQLIPSEADAFLLDCETIDYLFLPEEKDIKIITKAPLKTAYNDNEDIWIRNGDMNGFYASNYTEVIDLNENRKNKKYGIRPLMWIKYE